MLCLCSGYLICKMKMAAVVVVSILMFYWSDEWPCQMSGYVR